MCFLAVDFKYNFFIVSVYHTNKSLSDNIKYGDEILIKNANLIFTSLEFKGRLYSYQTVKVTEINNVLVNAQPVLEKYSQPTLISNTFT